MGDLVPAPRCVCHHLQGHPRSCPGAHRHQVGPGIPRSHLQCSPSRSADQLGRHQNPSLSKRSTACWSSAKQLVSVGPSSMVRTTKLATAGVRSLIIGSASTQDAQYAASEPPSPPLRFQGLRQVVPCLCSTCPHHAPVRIVLRAQEAGFSECGWRGGLNFGADLPRTLQIKHVGLLPRDVVPLPAVPPSGAPRTRGCPVVCPTL